MLQIVAVITPIHHNAEVGRPGIVSVLEEFLYDAGAALILTDETL